MTNSNATTFSRRSFLKGGAALGAIAAAGSMLTSCSTAQASPDADATDASGAVEYPDAEPIAPVEPPEHWDVETDVLVVGSGSGGMIAAALLSTNNVSVMLCEKEAKTGGASRHAGGVGNPFGGSKAQDAMELSWPVWPRDINAFVREYEKQNFFTVDEKLIKSVALAAGPAIDFAMDIGCTWFVSPFGYCDVDMMPMNEAGEPDPVNGKKVQNGVQGFSKSIDAIQAAAEKAGADIRVGTEMTALVMDGEDVVGIKVKIVNSGTEEYYKANKGVILCCGGFGMNRDMLAKYCPSCLESTVQGGPMPNNTGEAIRMGIGVGADMAGFDSWSSWEGAIDYTTIGGDGEWWHYFWNGARQLFHNPFLLINNRGERVPYYSHGISGFEVSPVIQMGDMANCAVYGGQPDGAVYNIMDSHYAENVFNIAQSTFVIDESRVPLREGDPVIKNNLVTTDWEAELEAAIECGAVKRADTIEELADMLQLDRDIVKNAVTRWNETCAAGVDTELSTPYDPTWLNPVVDGPFLAAKIGGQMAKTLCGLRIDENLQVMRPNGTPIKGLYANCFTAGGLSGENNYGGSWNGTLCGGVGSSLVSGYRAAQNFI